jgi:hypothetical protein
MQPQVFEARMVRGEASMLFLAPRGGGPTCRLCPLGVPNKAMARRGPNRRMVPDSWRTNSMLRHLWDRLVGDRLCRFKC